ncbi:hypothetical protein [Inquilinus sp. CA228]|uniref:hypothetical protein n=1 Tax=Inquilinus sp. CA228 TaxID=3455609 RepID=UPI003F8D58AC
MVDDSVPGGPPAGFIYLLDAVWMLCEEKGLSEAEAEARLLLALAYGYLMADRWRIAYTSWDPSGYQPVSMTFWRKARRMGKSLPAERSDIIEEARFRTWMDAGMRVSMPVRVRIGADEDLPDPERGDDDIIPFPAPADVGQEQGATELSDGPASTTAAQAAADPPALTRRVSTAAAITACKDDLVRRMLAGAKEPGKTRDQYLKEFMDGRSDLLMNGARTAWRLAIEETEGRRDDSWTKPGQPY